MNDSGKIDYPDASPSYRGYRHQALYVLHRILGASPDVRFRPEHHEDLAVYDCKDRLQELVQVKDHSQPLQLSDFHPAGESSFFARCADAICTHHGIKLTLASFGLIGPELKKAIERDDKERDSIAGKIAACGRMDEEMARRILARLQVEECSETALQAGINAVLSQMVTAINPSEALDALSFWVFRCSETTQRITRDDFSKRILGIGRYMADLTCHQAEWLATIHPIEDTVVPSERIPELAEQFHSGIAARYEHIQADLDVVRPMWMQILDEKLSSRTVVFVHAPSGQGKSTLAYRYLKERCPAIARYEVKHVENASHALRIARALGGQVRTLGLPVTVYFDIPPRDEGWLELIKELSFYKDISIIATIREEDWRRANVSGADFGWHDVEIGFTKQEAREIFDHLARNSCAPRFASFDEAWERFGERGPLLEFVHLVTQGGLLRERLQSQIEGLQDQVRQGRRNERELNLLRMVSVASAFASRLNARPLLKELQFPGSGNPLNLLEKEYLVRTSEDGLFIEGLHPIRSRILADLLCDPIAATWGETARECLPFLDERRLETFLLCAFSESVDLEKPVLEGLRDIKATRWRQVASIARALLWLGVSRYVRTNMGLIRHVEHELGLPWLIALDFDIAGLVDKEKPLFGGLFPEEARKQMQELRQRQSAKAEVFMLLAGWLSTLTIPDEEPSSSEDWDGLAEVIYWNAREGEMLSIKQWFPWPKATKAIETMPIGTVANLVLALYESYGKQDEFLVWFTTNRVALLDEFRKQTLTVKIEDDGRDELEAHFIVRFDLWPDPQSPGFDAVQKSNPLHAEARYRLEVLRKLIPDRNRFSCKGYGQAVLGEALPVDETCKSGVLKENLPIGWAVGLNSTLCGLVEFALRPSTWREYVHDVIDTRQNVIKAFGDLTQAISVYYQSRSYLQVVGGLLDLKAWRVRIKVLESTSRLPQCVADRFGFITESNVTSPGTKGNDVRISGFNVERYRSWNETFRKYRWGASNFMNQSVNALNIMPAIGRGVNKYQSREAIIERARALGLSDTSVAWSLSNLSDAYEALPAFQDEYRRLLPEGLLVEDLTTLEDQEREAFADLWPLWYGLVYQPRIVIKDPIRVCRKKEDRLRADFLRACEKEFSHFYRKTGCRAGIAGEGPRLDRKATVWIVADSQAAVASHGCFEGILSSLRTAYSRQTNQRRLGWLLDREWGRIAVVPCVKGRPLMPAAWTLMPNAIKETHQLSWWDQMMTPVPAAALEGLGLKCWERAGLETGLAFLRSFMEFVVTATHIRQLEMIGDMDQRGLGILQDYVHELENERIPYYQRALDAATSMLDTFNGLSKIEQEERENLCQSVTALRQWFELAKCPRQLDGEPILMALSEMAEWSGHLQEAIQYAAVAYLFWADDVLEFEQVPRGHETEQIRLP